MLTAWNLVWDAERRGGSLSVSRARLRTGTFLVVTSPPATSTRRTTLLKWMVGALTVHALLFVIFGWGGPADAKSRLAYLYDYFGFIPLQFGSALLLMLAAFRLGVEPALSRGLRRIGFGFLVLGVASCVYFVAAWDGTPLPYLSWADSIYFLFYPAIIVGLRSLPRVNSPRDRLQDLLGFLSVLTAFGALITFSFRFELANRDIGNLQRALILASSAAQLLTLMTLSGSLERVRRAPHSSALLLLFGGLAASLLTDLVLQIVYSVGYKGANFGVPIAVAVNVVVMLAGLRFLTDDLAPPGQAPRDEEREIVAFSPLPIIAVSLLAIVLVWLANAFNLEGTGWLILGLVIVNVLLLIRDLRASRLAATALGRNAEAAAMRRLDALVRHLADPIVVLNDDGSVQFASAKAREMFGDASTPVEGHKLPPDRNETQRGEWQAFLDRVRARNGEPIAYQWMLHHPRGIRHIETVGIDLRHEEAVGGIVLHHRDISEQEALAERLRHAQKLEVAGRLASGIAHDFNNVLTAVQAGAELARFELPEDSPAQQDLSSIESAAQRGAALTRRLLTFVRQEKIPGADVPIGAVVVELVPLMTKLVGESISIGTPSALAPWIVKVDRAELEHVLFNLLSNARDAMPNGGRIDIELQEIVITEPPSASGEWVIAPPTGRFARLCVRDSGHGMTEDVRRRMFDPFFTMRSGGRGTGLGLIGVHPLVQGAGGGLEVHSSERGTEIAMLLPIVGDWSGAVPVPRRVTPVGQRRGRVLLVEDDPAVRDNLERLLTAHGYRCDQAPGVADARARLAEARYDCVVSDVMMPVEDGLQLAEWIRHTHPNVPILLISGHTGTSLDTPHVAAVNVAFLRKPFSGAELVARIDALVNRS
jgi:PAS domain S-box-containing protein